MILLEQLASVQSSPKIRPYPPRVPEAKAELERAICLLGNRTKAELNLKAHSGVSGLTWALSESKRSTWMETLSEGGFEGEAPNKRVTRGSSCTAPTEAEFAIASPLSHTTAIAVKRG